MGTNRKRSRRLICVVALQLNYAELALTLRQFDVIDDPAGSKSPIQRPYWTYTCSENAMSPSHNRLLLLPVQQIKDGTCMGSIDTAPRWWSE